MDKDLEKELIGKGLIGKGLIENPREQRRIVSFTQAYLDSQSVESLVESGKAEREEIEGQARKFVHGYVGYGVRQGQRLIAIKSKCEHGEFVGHRDRVTGGGGSLASQYMRMAKYRDEITHCKSQREAMEVIREISRRERDEKRASKAAKVAPPKPTPEPAIRHVERTSTGVITSEVNSGGRKWKYTTVLVPSICGGVRVTVGVRLDIDLPASHAASVKHDGQTYTFYR